MVEDVDYFDTFARPYDLLMPPAREKSLRVGLELAERTVGRALDVGGGTGRGASAVGDVDWIVVDLARGMLERARDHGFGAVQGDGSRLPVGDGRVDAVLIIDALHHFADPQGAIEEAARVLEPGGVLVVREFHPGTLRGRFLVAAEGVVGFDSQFWYPEALADRMRAAGLTASVPEDGFGYTVAGVKPSQG